MYHIKQDKRSQSTAQTIEKGMYECLKTKMFHEITISDIYKMTGISRATIYRQFDTTEDILIYMCEHYIKEVEACFSNAAVSDIKTMGKLSFRIFMEKYEFLEILIKNHRQDLLQKVYEVNFKHLDAEQLLLKSLDDMERQYMWAALKANMSAVLTVWLERGRMETPDELYQIAMKYGKIMRYLAEM